MRVLELAVVVVVVAAMVLSWLAMTLGRAERIAQSVVLGGQARDAMTQFADRALELETVADILLAAREAIAGIFGGRRAVAFERGAEGDTWDARVLGGEALGAVSPMFKGSFGWFKHNPRISALGDLGDPRFGAMRAPLRELLGRYEIDLLIPLVEHDEVIAVLGIALGRGPTALDRELLMLLRLELTAACANVKLHREAAHVLTLAREVDLASAVKLALVPDETEGTTGALVWASHGEAAGEASSDFFGLYDLGEDRTLVVIGDAVGGGLAGSMVSAVVKSCCDAVVDANRARVAPGELLTVLNAALFRPGQTTHTSCFAALFDVRNHRLTYANAGHPFPYRLKPGGAPAVGSLAGSGSLLGDGADAHYRENRAPLASGDSFVFFTDGIARAVARDGVAFGERRLQRILAGVGAAAPGEVRSQLVTALVAHRDGARLPDDLAVVVVRTK